MKNNTINGLVSAGLASLCACAYAGEYSSIMDSLLVSETSPQLCKQLTEAPRLYKDDKGSILNEFSLILRGQYQMVGMSPAGANRYRNGADGHDDEWRRFYVGGRAVMFENKLTLHTMLNVGELNGAHREVGGRWARTRRDWSIYELYARYTHGDVSYSLGKIAPNLTKEFAVSSSEILTVERTTIANQLDTESNWGLLFSEARKDVPVLWNFGVMLNGAGVNLSDEIQLNSDDNVFLKGTLVWDTSDSLWGEKSNITTTYAHNFSRFDGRVANPNDFYNGPGAKDIVAVSWNTQKGDFYLQAEALAGFRLENTNRGQNVYGFYVIPSYRINSHWEGVFRYQLALGDDSVQAYGRYYPYMTTYPSRVDSLNAFYMGMNYYLCGDNPALFRLMFGVEYTTTSVSQPEQKGYSGWTYMAALRFKF